MGRESKEAVECQGGEPRAPLVNEQLCSRVKGEVPTRKEATGSQRVVGIESLIPRGTKRGLDRAFGWSQPCCLQEELPDPCLLWADSGLRFWAAEINRRGPYCTSVHSN